MISFISPTSSDLPPVMDVDAALGHIDSSA